MVNFVVDRGHYLVRQCGSERVLWRKDAGSKGDSDLMK